MASSTIGSAMVTDIFVTRRGAATARPSSYLRCASGAVVYGATALRRRAAICVTSRSVRSDGGQWAQLVLARRFTRLSPQSCSEHREMRHDRAHDC